MDIEKNAYELANDAGVSCPDSPDSPGANFLLGVLDAVNEAITWAKDHDEELEPSDMAHDIADGAVPIYTYEKWQTFVDLAAWQEDLEDYGINMAASDMDQASNVALYVIAERLAMALFEEGASEEETEDILADEETMTAITEGLAELNEEDGQ